MRAGQSPSSATSSAARLRCADAGWARGRAAGLRRGPLDRWGPWLFSREGVLCRTCARPGGSGMAADARMPGRLATLLDRACPDRESPALSEDQIARQDEGLAGLEPPLAPKDAFRIALPNFEGPLDLLLHLIREHKLDI